MLKDSDLRALTSEYFLQDTEQHSLFNRFPHHQNSQLSQFPLLGNAFSFSEFYSKFGCIQKKLPVEESTRAMRHEVQKATCVLVEDLRATGLYEKHSTGFSGSQTGFYMQNHLDQ